jgi:hypothetical protein
MQCSSSKADAPTYFPSEEKHTYLIPFSKVPVILATHYIVVVSHTNNHGFGPIYPVAANLPVGSMAKQ